MKEITITDMVELIMVVAGKSCCTCGLEHRELIVKMMSKVLDMTELSTEAKKIAILPITERSCFILSHYATVLNGDINNTEQLLKYGREGYTAGNNINYFLSGQWGEIK